MGSALRSLMWGTAGLLAVAALLSAGQAMPDVNWLLARQSDLRVMQAESPWQFGSALFMLMTLLCALALPGCSVVALGAGLFYGFALGTVIVVVGSTVGATLSFLASRYLWRDAVRRRWGNRLAGIEAGLARDGAYCLFSLRVAPIIPFGLLNPLMGLSAMPTWQFFSVSLLGMFAGSAVYVYAGTTLAAAQQWHDLFSPGLMAALAGVALLPWLTRAVWKRGVDVCAARRARALTPQRTARRIVR